MCVFGVFLTEELKYGVACFDSAVDAFVKWMPLLTVSSVDLNQEIHELRKGLQVCVCVCVCLSISLLSLSVSLSLCLSLSVSLPLSLSLSDSL